MQFIQDSQCKKKNLPVIALNLETLPSRGKPYPKGAEISYRPYTFGEIKKISQSKFSLQQKIEFLFEGIYTTNIDKYDITVGDFHFITLLRRLSTLKDNRFQIECLCKSCNKNNKYVKSLTDISFSEIKAEKVPYIIEIEGDIYEFMPLTINNMIAIEKLENINDTSVGVYAGMLYRVNGEPVTIEQAVNYIENIPYYEIQKLIELDDKLDHKVENMVLKCGHCSFEFDINLDSSDDALVLPFRGDENIVTN